MIQLTTPTHCFSLPINVDIIDEVRITYAQNKEVIITKTTEECDMEGKMIKVTLTQDDTKKFIQDVNIQIQINVKTKDGKRLASRQFVVSCYDNLDDEVM